MEVPRPLPLQVETVLPQRGGFQILSVESSVSSGGCSMFLCSEIHRARACKLALRQNCELTSRNVGVTVAIDARGKLSSAFGSSRSDAAVARINSERRSHDTTGQCLQPSRRSEGTARIVELEQTDQRLAKPHNA